MLSSIISRFSSISVRSISSTPAVNASVFTKKQKKVDADVAKAREARRRKRLAKEIRQMLKHAKKPKPVTEMSIDVKASRNLEERYRPVIELSEAEIDERAVVVKAYNTDRNNLMRQDIRWIEKSVREQDKALSLLKKVAPHLYDAAVALPEDITVYSATGPCLTPPVPDYKSPDGDYQVTTKRWE